jgi:hypothetical protein
MGTALNLPLLLPVDAFLARDAPLGRAWQLVDRAPQATAARASARPLRRVLPGDIALRDPVLVMLICHARPGGA